MATNTPTTAFDSSFSGTTYWVASALLTATLRATGIVDGGGVFGSGVVLGVGAGPGDVVKLTLERRGSSGPVVTTLPHLSVCIVARGLRM